MQEKRKVKPYIGSGSLSGFLIASLLVCGCAGRQQAAVPGHGYPSLDAALNAVAASDPGSGALTATARIEVRLPGGDRHVLKAALMIEKPARLRLESIPPFGPPDFFLSIDKEEMRVFLPEKEIFYIDRATRRNISRFLPLSLPGEEIVSLLMGRIPLGDGEISPSQWQGEGEERLYRIDRRPSRGETHSLWIDPANGLIRRIRSFSGEGDLLYTADFADHAPAGKGLLPQRLTITQNTLSMTIHYRDIRWNDTAAAFSLSVPEGIIPRPFE